MNIQPGTVEQTLNRACLNYVFSSFGVVREKGSETMNLCLEFTIAMSLMVLLQQNETDFQDLGKLLLGGVAAAIAIGIAFTLVRIRLRDKKPQRSGFITIGGQKDED